MTGLMEAENKYGFIVNYNANKIEIAKAIEKVIPCQRVGLSVIGLEVPHTHLHLVPIDTANDLNFTRSKMPADQGKLAEIALMIKSQL